MAFSNDVEAVAVLALADDIAFGTDCLELHALVELSFLVYVEAVENIDPFD